MLYIIYEPDSSNGLINDDEDITDALWSNDLTNWGLLTHMSVNETDHHWDMKQSSHPPTPPPHHPDKFYAVAFKPKYDNFN